MQFSAVSPSRLFGMGLAVLSLASLAAISTAPAASALAKAASAPGSAASAAGPARQPQWHVRTVLRESAREQMAAQVVDLRAGADYALVSSRGQVQGTYRLQRTDLATGAVRKGPVFGVSGLTLAAGSLWVSGAVPAGSRDSSLRLYQVNPRTLTVIRSRQRLERAADYGSVQVAAGPGHTVWAGILGTVLRIGTRTGATIRRITLPGGAAVGGIAVNPARRYLYVAAEGGTADGGTVAGDAFEYGARSGRLLASNSHEPLNVPCDGCAALTAVPDGVQASFRTGTEGQSVLLRRRGLGSVPLSGSIFRWDMAEAAATIYGGGALWLATGSFAGDIGCIAPAGVVRHQITLAQLKSSLSDLLAVNASAHEVYALGASGVIAITPPRGCWA